MKNLLCFIYMNCSCLLSAQTLDFEWAKQFGGANAATYARSITTDPSGNVFTLGRVNGSADFDPGPGVFTLNSGTINSTYICKLDSSGNFLWAGKIDIRGGSITSDKYGNVFVLGVFEDSVDVDPGIGVYSFNSDTVFKGPSTCIVKLDNAGNFTWAKALYGGPSSYGGCYGSSICIDSKQNIYIGGSFNYGSNDFDPGPGVVSLTGNYQWVPSYTGYPITAFFVCSLDSSGNFRYAKKEQNSTGDDGSYYSGNAICTPNGETISFITHFYGSGHLGNITYSSNQINFEKRDINGDLLWIKTLKNAINTAGSVFWPIVTTDRNGNIWVAGSFTGLINFDPNPTGSYNLGTPTANDTSLFILKLDPNGNFLHAAHLGRTRGKAVTWAKIFTDVEKNCYLGGALTGTFDVDPGVNTVNLSSPTNNGFLLKLDEDFQFKWATLIGEGATSDLYDICGDNFGNFFISGGFSGSGDFNPFTGNYNMSAAGTKDSYVIKLSGQLITDIKKQQLKDHISFFPNPTDRLLHLNTANTINNGKCTIIDLNGKIVKEDRNIHGNEFAIDLSGLQPGFYALEISDETQIARIKIAKE